MVPISLLMDVKDQLMQKVAQLLAKLEEPQKEKRPTLLETLNSPFFVTVLGGLTAVLITALIQNRGASNQREREDQKSRLERNTTALSEFTKEFPYTLYFLHDKMRRYLWLSVEGQRIGTNTYTDGKNYLQSRSIYETQVKDYSRMNHDALCARIGTAFETAAVLTNLINLDQLMDAMITQRDRTTNSWFAKANKPFSFPNEAGLAIAQLDELKQEANVLFETIVGEMGIEIKSETKRSP